MTKAELLARQIDDTRAWTLALLEDFADGDWTFQPRAGMAHALWLCGHLAVAQDTLVHVRCLGGESVLDPSFSAHFPIGAPVPSAAEHDYPSVRDVLDTMAAVHEKTLAAVRSMSEALLAEPAYGKDGAIHPHYRDKAGAVCHCSRHEAFHAGQIASIRGLLGKPFLR